MPLEKLLPSDLSEEITQYSLELLLIAPCLEPQKARQARLSMRLEPTIPNQETPHIGMAYLLAVAKQSGLRARFVDMTAEDVSQEALLNLVKRSRPVVVGFTAFTIHIKAAAALASQIRESCPETLITVGGPHVSAEPERTLLEFPSFDFVICGEAEEVLPRIFEVLPDRDALGRLPGVVTRQGRGPLPAEVDIAKLPMPAWEDFDLGLYPGTYPHRSSRELPVVTGRGCPYRCVFCCRALGDHLRRRPVASVLDELERDHAVFGAEAIAFMDENLLLRDAWSRQFLGGLIDRGLHRKLRWACTMRASTMSQELTHEMRRAGCYYIFYGFESATDDSLQRIRKGCTVAQIRSAVAFTRNAGIIPVGAFIFGLPGDTQHEAQEAIKLAHELQLYSITFPLAVPFPGTDLRELAREGRYGLRILSDDWDHYGKQEPGVLDSADFPYHERVRLQKQAYTAHPKKRLDDFLRQVLNVEPEAFFTPKS